MAASAGVNNAGVAANVCVSDAMRHYLSPIRLGRRNRRHARAITRATIGKKFLADGRAAIADLPSAGVLLTNGSATASAAKRYVV